MARGRKRKGACKNPEVEENVDSVLEEAIQASLETVKEDEERRKNSSVDGDDDDELMKAIQASLSDVKPNEEEKTLDVEKSKCVKSQEKKEEEDKKPIVIEDDDDGDDDDGDDDDDDDDDDPPPPVQSEPTKPDSFRRRSNDDSDEYYSDDSETELNRTVNLMFGRGGKAPDYTTGRNIHMHGASHITLSSEEATNRMKTVFKKGLESKLNAQQMEPCRGIMTPLHPHQKCALAWMFNQENKENQGMIGGILADDMGLGKSLTIISLILTNHHDGRPIAKKSYGYVRQPIEYGKRKVAARKNSRSVLNPIITNVPKPLNSGGQPVKLSSVKFFSSSESSDGEENGVSSSTARSKKSRNGKSKSKLNAPSSDSEGESDEFGKMLKDSKTSLRDKFASKEAEAAEATAKLEETQRSEDEDLDDFYEKWKNMSQEEQTSMVKKHTGSMDTKLNLDGLVDSESEEDEVKPGKRRNKLNAIFSSDEDDESKPRSKRRGFSKSRTGKQASKRAKVDYESEQDLPDIDFDDDDVLPKNEPATTEATAATTENTASNGAATTGAKLPPNSTDLSKKSGAQATEAVDEENVNIIIPPRQPAERGKRPRPTLIVCPTSLISHWCAEIDKHVDPCINIKVRVHHGSSKALIGAELNMCDIVITTYGTLASELEAVNSPLLHANWLRVVLDEGHSIKNHRTKTAKAANLLNSKRRWVVTGTPIQNNLLELWSLVHWLNFDLYAHDLAAFKYEIERPCKNRDERGYERLQTLMDTICLRRTKQDKRANGDPIVRLPTKTIIMRDVKFDEDEKFCYDILRKKATAIVERYQRKGQLMRNYAQILVLMLRLRQMCCHRELVPGIDWTRTLQDKPKLEKELTDLVETEAGELNGVAPDDPNDPGHKKQMAEKLRQIIKDGVTEECSVCLEDLKTPVITLCGHIYCRDCIERVIATTKPPVCPLCRGGIKKAELLEASTAADNEENEEGNNAPKKPDETLEALGKIDYKGSTSSKVNAVLKELIRIRQERPGDKMIVVSQFTSFLSMVQPLLAQEDFRFVRLDGTMNQTDRRDVINLFHEETPNAPNVLLLSLKAGGVGLNLTCANHLLLLDPAWNPAAEWQCFDRIHRMGQTKEVFIYKFVTSDDSIEEKMLTIQEKKEQIISGAFHMPDDERRRQRINDILTIFNLGPATTGGGASAQ